MPSKWRRRLIRRFSEARDDLPSLFESSDWDHFEYKLNDDSWVYHDDSKLVLGPLRSVGTSCKSER